jgi:hypothetical protein
VRTTTTVHEKAVSAGTESEQSGRPPFSPHEWQQRAQVDFQRLGGLFCGMPVGSGKSWVGAKCAATGSRSVVIVPAALLEQAVEQYREYGVTQARFISYSKISRNAEILRELNPDVLILDEAHNLKNVTSSAWGRRIARFLHERPQCRVVAMTGSIMHRSARDYLPLLVWALRKNPFVRANSTSIERVAEWADAHPREWLDKLRACPGVYIDGAPSWGGEITLSVTKLPPAAPLEYERARAGLAPDGWALPDPLSRREVCSQLAWGFCRVRDPRPSERLLQAQRAWAAQVRQALDYRLADTELGARAVYPLAYAEYRRVVESEPVGGERDEWFASDFPLDIPGAKTTAIPGTILWCHHQALGEHVSRRMGIPYHHEGALDADGTYLGDQTAPVVIASIGACHRGVDGVQHRYDHNVILEPPQDARIWQQLLGRTARQGRDVSRSVSVEVVLRCSEHEAAFKAALNQARGIEEATGQEQLLLKATPGRDRESKGL